MVSVQTNPQPEHIPTAMWGYEATGKAQGLTQPSGSSQGKGKAGRMKKMNPHRGSVMRSHRKMMDDTVILGKEPEPWRLWTDVGIQTYPYRTPIPRSREGIHPSRSSTERNMITPMRSGHSPVSQPQGRQNSSVGVGRSKKQKPAAERQRECITGWIGNIPNLKGC